MGICSVQALKSLWAQIRAQTLRLQTAWSLSKFESGLKMEIPGDI